MERVRMLPFLFALALSGCLHHRIQAPSDFVVLQERGAYASRATSAQGVVLAVREIPNEPRASHDFWNEAIRTQLVKGRGYALLGTEQVRAKTGQPGTQLRLGRDQAGAQYLYWVSIFVTERTLFIIEAGGRKDRFEAAQAEVEKAIAGASLRGTPY